MSPTKISIILPNLAGGGAERLHVHLAQAWIEQGISVEFVLMAKKGALISAVPPSASIVDLKAKRVRSLLAPLVRYLRIAKPSVTLAAMWPLTSISILAWLLAGRPGRIYVSDHSQLSISTAQELGIPRWLLSTVIRATYPRASGIISVSDGVRRDLCALARLPLSLVNVIYNPTAVGISTPDRGIVPRDDLWGRDFTHRILSVGTLKAQKDHVTLIHAISRISKSLNIKLIILGEGELRQELEELIRKLKLENNISLPGFTLNPYPWYQSADLFVLSSRWEGFGNVIVEALECGTPVVSTDCPSGPAEILEGNKYGILVPIRDPETMAAAIQAALQRPVDRSLLMKRAQDFSVSVISKQYLDLFQLRGIY